VQLQLLVASGERLPFSQSDVVCRGHAIEARVNAEDPAGGRFVPTAGVVSRFRPPGGPWVRTDAGYQTGDVVSPHYDNLLAKVVAWGPDRESARVRLLRALSEAEVEGVATTVPAHLAVLSHPDFVSVAHSTTWLATRVDLSGLQPAPPPGPPPTGARATEVAVELGGRLYAVTVWAPPGFAGPTDPGAAGAGPASVPGTPLEAPASHAGGVVTAPMQGTVVKVLVKVGDEVSADQPVCVLEAMKMENNILAEAAGTVSEVRVEVGASVGTGDILAVISA
jgi:acetyl-CoA/propionyl-CoA carboxylase biotin carboxyl carrier protein